MARRMTAAALSRPVIFWSFSKISRSSSVKRIVVGTRTLTIETDGMSHRPTCQVRTVALRNRLQSQCPPKPGTSVRHMGRRTGSGLFGVVVVLAILGKCTGLCGTRAATVDEPSAASVPPSAPAEPVVVEPVVDPASFAHEARVQHYASLKPAQRLAEVASLCPSSKTLPRRTVQQILANYVPCEDEDGAMALLESVAGTEEAARLKSAIEAAKKQTGLLHQAVTRSAKCCDGTLSDACTCADVHQGCCSHHGGVCGCE